MNLYDHAYSFGLEVISVDRGGRDVTGADLRRALLARLAVMSDDEVVAACDGGSPFDSAEVERETAEELRGADRQQLRGPHGTKIIASAAQKRLINPEVTPITYQCKSCGSTDVQHDAWAEWSEPEQRLVLSATFDATHCNACDGECKVVAVLV